MLIFAFFSLFAFLSNVCWPGRCTWPGKNSWGPAVAALRVGIRPLTSGPAGLQFLTTLPSRVRISVTYVSRCTPRSGQHRFLLLLMCPGYNFFVARIGMTSWLLRHDVTLLNADVLLAHGVSKICRCIVCARARRCHRCIQVVMMTSRLRRHVTTYVEKFLCSV